MTATKLQFMSHNIAKFTPAFLIKLDEMLSHMESGNFEQAEVAHKTLISGHWAEIKDYNSALKTLLQFN